MLSNSNSNSFRLANSNSLNNNNNNNNNSNLKLNSNASSSSSSCCSSSSFPSSKSCSLSSNLSCSSSSSSSPSSSSSSSLTSSSPNFPFPFTPYPSQLHLMRTIYDSIDQGNNNINIIESPTGTGKSLCIIIAALYWLLEVHPNQKKQQHSSSNETNSSSSLSSSSSSASSNSNPSWVSDYFKSQELRDEEDKENQIQSIKTRVEKINNNLNNNNNNNFNNKRKSNVIEYEIENENENNPIASTSLSSKELLASLVSNQTLLASQQHSHRSLIEEDDSDLIIDWVDPDSINPDLLEDKIPLWKRIFTRRGG